VYHTEHFGYKFQAAGKNVLRKVNVAYRQKENGHLITLYLVSLSTSLKKYSAVQRSLLLIFICIEKHLWCYCGGIRVVSDRFGGCL